MSHPLEDVIQQSEGFVLIGDSEAARFPALSFHSYTETKKKFYCLDLGGLTQSRGKSAGHKVYTSASELPDDHDDLAVIWVKPGTATRAVDVAHEAGCKRVWFSFKTGHKDAVAHARELGMEVVEIGRCPVYYMDDMVPVCAAHRRMVKLSGTWAKPPQTDPTAKRREIF